MVYIPDVTVFKQHDAVTRYLKTTIQKETNR